MNDLVVREYLGSSVEFKVIDGKVYANATQMCKIFGKLFADWRRLKQTDEMVVEVSETMGIPIADLVIVENGIGSMIHEELVLELAGWLNIKFRRWCQKQITTLIREGSVSLKPKTEEEMLLELFPSADNSLISLTATSIRDTKRLTLENKVKQETIERKTEMIDNMSEHLDEVRMRKIVTDYVVSYANRKNLEIRDVYNDLYSFFGRSIKTDITHAKKKYIETNRNEVDKNKEHNRKNKLKGLDRAMPCTYHKPSTVEFITNILSKGTELIYAMAKFFEVPAQQIIDKYHSVEIEEELS